ncbi:PAS domain S-box protein [Virgibacillus ihumii]|uniref:PAS domain S-box protein n=1 Tax=Virgibacillus ihumii TaxID=2686091 RepID=UPI00157CB0BB|nr:PAS domain S-box protein [Virgibacillus ihumii]
MQTTFNLENPSLFIHAFEHASIGMAIVALDGTPLKVNHSLCDILGYHETELLSVKFKDITHPDDIESNLSFMYEDFKGSRKSHHMEKRLIHKKGYQVWVLLSVSLIRDSNNHPSYFISQVQDITDWKLAEEKVIEGEKRYESLIEESPYAIIIFSNDGECIFVNTTGVKLLGAKNKDEVIGINCNEIIAPKDWGWFRESLERTKNGKVMNEIDGEIMGVTGEVIDVQVRLLPAYHEGDQSVLVVMKDANKKKKTEELMVKFEKLTVAGQLAAGIAHEVRNPLTAIKGFLQIMESNGTGNKEYAEVIFSELNRIEELLGELLVLARPQGAKFSERDLKILIEQVISLIESQAKLNNIKIEKSIESDIPYINCDGNQLKQVFINLLKNAIEAMSNGGTISVTLKKYNADTIVVRIEDQGYGIPDHLLRKIGEPFFSTKEDGTGLGIMICEQIIENHKGFMEIDSSFEGTVVDVHLPLAKAL